MCVVIIGIPNAVYTAELKSDLDNMPVQAYTNYVPHTGEFMSTIQIHYSRLWFAGDAKNWELANFEIGEIKEGMVDIVKYRPIYEKGVHIATMVYKYLDQPMADIQKAIKSKDRVKFRQYFNNLTSACNACHQESGVGFIKVKRPSISPSDQDFAVK